MRKDKEKLEPIKESTIDDRSVLEIDAANSKQKIPIFSHTQCLKFDALDLPPKLPTMISRPKRVMMSNLNRATFPELAEISEEPETKDQAAGSSSQKRPIDHSSINTLKRADIAKSAPINPTKSLPTNNFFDSDIPDEPTINRLTFPPPPSQKPLILNIQKPTTRSRITDYLNQDRLGIRINSTPGFAIPHPPKKSPNPKL